MEQYKKHSIKLKAEMKIHHSTQAVSHQTL